MKRFISAASCPSCKQADCLYFETEEREDRVHCSRCDYTSLRGENFVADTWENSEQDEDENREIKWH